MIRRFIFALSICAVMISCNSIERKEIKGLPSIALIVKSPTSAGHVTERKEAKRLPSIALIVKSSMPVGNVQTITASVENKERAFIPTEARAAAQYEVMSSLMDDMIQTAEIIPELQAKVIHEPVSENVPEVEVINEAEEDAVELPGETEENFQLGLRKATEGNHRGAVDAYRKAILINPDNKRAHYNIAVEYINTGNIRYAAKEYNVLKYLDHAMANKLYKQAFDTAFENKDSTYTVQVGAYINKRFAVTMSETLKSEYLTAYIEKENNFHNVRIAGIQTKGLGKDIVGEVNKRFRIKSALMTSSEADLLSRKNRSGSRSFRKNNYLVQVGAYRNINYAKDMMKKLQHDNMPSFIKKEGSFNKVRINGIKTVEDGNLLVNNIYDKHKIEPFILLGYR